jgi:carbamate kinase
MTGVRPLLVVAIGGHALSSPAADATLAGEREAARRAGAELAALARRGFRLLIVHGNGPQVGRLLRDAEGLAELDIRVAQTQGELGYLLAAALESQSGERVLAVVTRVRVDPDDPRGADPEKPIGPVLGARPDGPALAVPGSRGWRRTVPSPWPLEVLEQPLIARLLDRAHVIAGGGGGVPVTGAGVAVPGVIDKDRVAALLAVELDAAAFVIGTDVDGVYRNFGAPGAELIGHLSVDEARRLLDAGYFPAGSMGPKVASAAAFAEAAGRAAIVTTLGALEAGLDGAGGTRIG